MVGFDFGRAIYKAVRAAHFWTRYLKAVRVILCIVAYVGTSLYFRDAHIGDLCETNLIDNVVI